MKKALNNNEIKPCQFSDNDLDGDEDHWNINSSMFSKSTCNPVRKLIEQMKIEPNPSLQMIALSIGDPTVLSHIGKPNTVTDAIKKCIEVILLPLNNL